MVGNAGVLEISLAKCENHEPHTLLVCMLYSVTDIAGFMSEHQFAVFMHILKRAVRNWNNNIDTVSENDDVTNVPWY